jgi:CD80-like C2-set immunoglobulin domain
VTCIARDSNPPAALKWWVSMPDVDGNISGLIVSTNERVALFSRWIGTKDVTDSAQTINQTSQQGKLFNTISTLTYQFMPLDNSGQLKCEISHPALAGSLSSYSHLNVLCTWLYCLLESIGSLNSRTVECPPSLCGQELNGLPFSTIF